MRRWRILTIGQTEVLLHPAVIVCLIYGRITGHLRFMLLAFASILVHEMAHAVTSALFGQPPVSLEITPLGAVMRLEDEGMLSPWKRLMVVLAGPAMSMVLCTAAISSVRHDWLNQDIGRELFLGNIAILLLNLLPVVPLDGGRLLALILSLLFSTMVVRKWIRLVSRTAGIGLIILNIVSSIRYGGWNLSLGFAGCCILYSTAICNVTQAMADLRFFLDRKIRLEKKGVLRTVCFTALQSTPLQRLIKMLPPGQETVFICLEAGTERLLGCVHESELVQEYLKEPGQSLGEAIKRTKQSYDLAK